MQYATGTQQPMQAPLANGAVRLALEQRPPNVRCRTTWPPTGMQDDPIPTGIAATALGIEVVHLAIDLDYFIWIHTDE